MTEDKLEAITRSMTYSVPQLGDNVLKHATLVMVCKNKGCYKPVTVTDLLPNRVIYSCPDHGQRKYNQFDWLDITGSTMLQFRKVGTNA
jgi:hypothetical protein